MKVFRKSLHLLLLVEAASAFLPGGTRATTSTKLRGHISEWRDLFFEDAPGEEKFKENRFYNNNEPVREVCIFPFPLTDILLQGETKELCLYEDRFHQLFAKANSDHAGIVAMGFIAPPSGMLQSMPLCEIENFVTMPGDTGFGNQSILATIRVVGRATLLDVQDNDDEPFMTGWCQELADDTMDSSTDETQLQALNEVADRCDFMFDGIVTLREELGLDDDDEEDADYDDDDLDDNDEVTGSRGALQKAIKDAKASDTQGYTTISTISRNSGSPTRTEIKRSIQDLTAMSWGYFSKEVWGEDEEESTFSELLKCRLQALNAIDLSDRLNLVTKMLKQQTIILTQKRDK